jgi:uncharacterized membrane protein YjjP (DUF1212 family)
MSTISYDEQTKITRAIIKAAVMMLEYGAESKLIEQTSQRMGAALGMDSVEMSLIPSAIVLSTLTPNQSVTTTLMAHHKPINMSIVYDVQRICIELEKEHHSIETVIERLEKIDPNYYNRWLVIFMVGFSCASFAYLAGADIGAFFITFLASCVAMAVRQELAKHKFISLIIFAITAFVATSVASLSYVNGISSTPSIAISSSVLLLVPGFPFINSFLDAVKGFLSMGWGRWLQATLLTLATSMGIIFAMSLLNIKGW